MDYLSQQERAQLQELRQRDPFVGEVLQQHDRILKSRKFARVQRKSRDFLAFVVTKTLLGKSDEIKETTIAVEVFGEPADFDPKVDSKVRGAGRVLRQRLLDYYHTEGHDDPIEITIPPHRYVARLVSRWSSIDVSVFENWEPKGNQQHFSVMLRDEIVYWLTQCGWLKARRVDSLTEGILIHEIIHAIVGTHEGHKGPFVTLARAVGLKGKPTATIPGEDLVRRLNALIGELGPYPHAALLLLQIKKDGTRLIKVACPACGYTVRATRKWLEIGSPICPTDKIDMEADI